jgi:hypothetical protein
VRIQYPPVEVRGETLDVQPGERWPVVAIKVGNITAIHFPIVFGRFYIFHLWNLESQPAVVIGMDLMSRLDELVLDYQRREVQMLAEPRHDQFVFK